jgi:hypothetical protein
LSGGSSASSGWRIGRQACDQSVRRGPKDLSNEAGSALPKHGARTPRRIRRVRVAAPLAQMRPRDAVELQLDRAEARGPVNRADRAGRTLTIGAVATGTHAPSRISHPPVLSTTSRAESNTCAKDMPIACRMVMKTSGRRARLASTCAMKPGPMICRTGSAKPFVGTLRGKRHGLAGEDATSCQPRDHVCTSPERTTCALAIGPNTFGRVPLGSWTGSASPVALRRRRVSR